MKFAHLLGLGLLAWASTVAQAGTDAQCDLAEDPQQVVHLRAADPLQLMACLGQVHAAHRGWQMEFLRRLAQGRQAELFGKDSIRQDFFMRLLGLEAEARRLLAEFPPEARARLEAYAAGVNQGFRVAEKGYEFRHWGYRPEAWRAHDSLLLMLLQSFDQTRKTFETDLKENDRAARFPGVPDSFWRETGMPWDVTVLKDGEYPKASAGKQPTQVRSAANDGPRFEAPRWASHFEERMPEWLSPAGMGSNNWVVAPRLSRTGKALFANDPHLGLKHPPFWYWIHLEAPGLDAIGASLPGIPWIVSGANRHLAWGLTNSYLDTARVFLVDESELKKSVSSRPWIWFKWHGLKLPFAFKGFRRTAQGWPILPLDSPRGKAWVLRWTGLGLSGKEVASFLDLNSAETVQEADRILAQVGAPSFNFVFADTRGGIGYRVVGKIPRADGPWPARIAESRMSEVENWPLLTADQVPHLLNPARGWIATANNRHWPADGQFFGGYSYAMGLRALRIEELLQSRPRHDTGSLARIQCDVQSVEARWFKDLLLGKLAEAGNIAWTPSELASLGELKAWDGMATRECRACPLYRRWMDHLLEPLQGKEAALFRALQKGGEPSGLRVEAQTVLDAFRAARADLHSDEAGYPKQTWGDWHQAPFEHLSGEPAFAVPALPTGGDEQSVNPGTLRWNGSGWNHTQGASHRLVVELSDPPQVYVGLAGSQEDLERPDLRNPEGPWQAWADCRQQKRNFPFDWKQAQSTPLVVPGAVRAVASGR